eukprot:CAMPEP_0197043774 /NCGR_PEP_ID=MMETSP1384-20130603/19977_1 /TAXON_ID=29189 /ORGANISM="Ammonia sp." /LENGTH=32 /DNA_ID= /DNA_START= /DNA_END= /DNA_ORIENTATION=
MVNADATQPAVPEATDAPQEQAEAVAEYESSE